MTRMTKTFLTGMLFLGIVGLSTVGHADDAIEHIQNTSVTIKSGSSEGSGNIITLSITIKDDQKANVNFILTAGHVVDDLRTVREIVDTDGTSKKVVEFRDASIVKEFRQKGRRVGETKLDAKVLKFSDADNGEDLALLLVLMYDFCDEGIEFYLDDDIPTVGTELIHCGSLLGQMGANSMTTGIMSQIGRVHKGVTYDQTTVTAFPGSSGGGVFLKSNDKSRYVGMVVRGSGETFNLMVPVRRVVKWAQDNGIEWIVNPKIAAPTMDVILKMPTEAGYKNSGTSSKTKEEEEKLIFMDGEHKWDWHNNMRNPTIILPGPGSI